MTPHAHDRDLIMALASGALRAPEERAARLELASCPECASELAFQEAALSALRAAPAPAMTDLESARLKRDLDTALGHERTVIPSPAQRKRRFNWVPAISIAAVMLALVLVAPALEFLGAGDGDDAAFETAAAEIDAGSTTGAPAADGSDLGTRAAAEAAPAEELAPVTQEQSSEFATDDAGDTVATASEVTSIDAAVDEADADALQAVLADVQTVVAGATGREDAGRSLAANGLIASDPGDDRCLDEGIAALVAPADSSYVLGDFAIDETVYRLTVHQSGADTVVFAHAPSTCEIVASAP